MGCSSLFTELAYFYTLQSAGGDRHATCQPRAASAFVVTGIMVEIYPTVGTIPPQCTISCIRLYQSAAFQHI